ncbi:MAG: hypothetical protein VR70_06500 [Rhodospirillaceae bacterium BRH_c57]|nr:MAG: hypothetical protein VR70_06500 [Rhodospirillaceae bacterium BRH_c57]
MAIGSLSGKLVPTINATKWREMMAALEDAEKTLKGDKTNAAAKKKIKQCRGQIDAYEAVLSTAVDAFADKLKELADARGEMGKLEPMPGPIQVGLGRLERIASGRGIELKDLQREQKRKALQTNPSKLTRVLGDINSDVVATNDLADEVDKEVDKHFAARIVTLRADIVALFPKGFSPSQIGLDQSLNTFSGKQKTKRWKNFDAAAKKFSDDMVGAALARDLELSVQALAADTRYKTLNVKKRNATIQDGLKKKNTLAEVEKALDDALDAQRMPNRSAWGKHFGMTGYSIIATKSKNGIATHITYDLNSWTTDARSGKVSVFNRPESAIFDDLFKVNWTYQIHGTAEVTASDGKFPHVYLYGKENRWGLVPLTSDLTAPKLDAVKKHVASELADFKKDILAKIKDAIKADGDI